MRSWHERVVAADSLWRDRPFVLFWLGRIISVSGSILTSVVLPILIFQMTVGVATSAILGWFSPLRTKVEL